MLWKAANCFMLLPACIAKHSHIMIHQKNNCLIGAIQAGKSIKQLAAFHNIFTRLHFHQACREKFKSLVCDCPHIPLSVSELKVAVFEASDWIVEANIDGYVNPMGIGCKLY